ncbi:MAG: RimK family protein [Phycisphaerae bacterium]
MANLLVVSNPRDWPLQLRGVQIVSAKQYLTDPTFSRAGKVRVVNLCRSYSYQSMGYYVSLMAAARGHKPQPDVARMQDLKSATLVQAMAEQLDPLIQKTLRRVAGEQFELSIYFGRTLAQRDGQLGKRLFGLFGAPLMRATFLKKRSKWKLSRLRAIPASEIPPAHNVDLVAAVGQYFANPRWSGTAARGMRYWMAILVDPEEKTPPSNEAFLERLIRTGRKYDLAAETITPDQIGRLGEYDALFIRATTSTNDYTYRFSRKAWAEGLAVIDDPVSIARCTNKVYLAELLGLHGVPAPKTVIVHRDNIDQALAELSLPCVLKQPDSSFSLGVVKAETAEQFRQQTARFLAGSDLLVAQQYLPTDFDWRIGLLDGRALYACRYYMARSHWQIVRHGDDGKMHEGRADTVEIDQVPPGVIEAARRAAALIGDGLYGVDIKEIDGLARVIEVNDNPSLDSGVEDAVLHGRLYEAIIESFIRRIERIRQAGRSLVPPPV